MAEADFYNANTDDDLVSDSEVSSVDSPVHAGDDIGFGVHSPLPVAGTSAHAPQTPPIPATSQRGARTSPKRARAAAASSQA